MFYYMYQITNNVNNKIYVGVHKTKNLDDGYMGSGKVIKAAIKKYGIENFNKTVLELFDNMQEMYLREAEIINDDFVARHDTYNLAMGGSGGSIDLNRKPFTQKHTQTTKDKISLSKLGQRHSEETKLKIKQNLFNSRSYEQMVEDNRRAASGSKTSEHKKNISIALVGRVGELSPSFGLRREHVTCPHCGKSGANNTMQRWHFDNCKLKI